LEQHNLAERTSGLASRINNLAVETSGKDSRALMVKQDELTKLAMLAIVKDLDASDQGYKEAVTSLEEAIQFIDTGNQAIQKVTDTINLVTKAINMVTKVLA
jgi:exonuclease VII small subunit